MRIRPGRPSPLGVTLDPDGANVALFSEVATAVEFCLFDASGRERRVRLPERTGPVWHGHVGGVVAGQRYGFRVHGPFEPARGLRCNPAKLLVDPHARRIEGELRWDPAVFGHDPDRPGEPSAVDSAPFVPRSVVVASGRAEDLGPRPDVAFEDCVVYELHVKSFTARMPGVPAALRGTYAGLASPAAIEHLRGLGIRAVELMPVQAFVHEERLVAAGLSNHWGYNPIAWSAPHAAYASGDPVAEFRAMVRALHSAGIEVWLDVVFNHTAESHANGPTLSFRGIDNSAYYRLRDDDLGNYVDDTGCGNTVDATHPFVLRTITDSLRHWVVEMGVDGFRFDLAVTLGRRHDGFDPRAPLFDAMRQDPILRGVKWVAEPWDVGPDGYRLGGFPEPWAEWNARYRDTIRDFWRGADVPGSQLAAALDGCPDLFAGRLRGAAASVNFVTCHDGFTLRDLVSYDEKHNEANGEDGRDGESHNRSWNCGVEGPTEDPAILALRARQVRNLLATLLLSRGVPMLGAGDEFGRTQGGNNNAYCHDSELTWIDWAAADAELVAFVRRAVLLRHEHDLTAAALRCRRPDGTPLGDDADNDRSGPTSSLVAVLEGAGRSICLLLHAGPEPTSFVVPLAPAGTDWEVALDSSDDDAAPRRVPGGATESVASRSVRVLVARQSDAT